MSLTIWDFTSQRLQSFKRKTLFRSLHGYVTFMFIKGSPKDRDRLLQGPLAEHSVRPETSFLSPYEILSCTFQLQGETFQIFSRKIDFLVWSCFGRYLQFFASENLFLLHCIVICSPAVSLLAQAPRQVVCGYFSNFFYTKLEFSFRGFLNAR